MKLPFCRASAGRMRLFLSMQGNADAILLRGILHKTMKINIMPIWWLSAAKLFEIHITER